MMNRLGRTKLYAVLVCALAVTVSAVVYCADLFAAPPSVEQALKLKPVQKDVDYDQPSPAEIEQCTIKAIKIGNAVGWEVRDGRGYILRQFLDTNRDNYVDQWRYFKNGLEVYRDVDSNFNNRVDQYRWFSTAGTRWGLDTNEDGVIDSWKMISAEEAVEEIVKALANRDTRRFARVALSPQEASKLGLGPEWSKQIEQKISSLASQFQKAATSAPITGNITWVQFVATRPGTIPAGTNGCTSNIHVYENVAAMAETDGGSVQVQIGTLIKVGDTWKTIDVPRVIAGDTSEIAAGGFFFKPPSVQPPTVGSVPDTSKYQDLLQQLEKLDQALASATSLDEQAKLNAKRADVLEQIAAAASTPAERETWLKQLADTISVAAQTGGYPDGARRLAALYEKVKNNESLAAYVRFRQINAEYGAALQSPDADHAKVQAEWLKQLEQFVADYPEAEDAAEAMLQLGMAKELAGDEKQATSWFERLLANFPDSPQAKKAQGALRRLDLVGKQLSLRGPDLNGRMVDLSQYRGKAVLIHYWASWCVPCKADIPVLKDLLARYGPSGFAIIGICLDSSKQEAQSFVNEHRLSWPQLYQEGGMDSPLAEQLGIFVLPTMILVGPDGKVVHRNIQAGEIENQLKQLLK